MKNACSITSAFLAVASTLVPLSSEAQTFLSVTSEETGETQILTEEEGFSMRFGGSKRSLHFSAWENDHFPHTTPVLSMSWFGFVRAPVGENLRPGFFPEAGCRNPQYGRSIGIELTEENPICEDDFNSIYGWASIRQIEFSENGGISKLELVFNQRRGSPDRPGHIVVVRHNASPMYFRIQSGRAGRSSRIAGEFHGDNSFFELDGKADEAVSFAASVPQDHWLTLITPPTGQTLQPGRYVVGASSRANRVGLELHRQFITQFTCRDFQGVLDVKQLRTSPDNQVTGMWAEYKVGCGRKASLSAEIRLGL